MARVRVDADGVRIVEHASRRRVVGAGAVLIALVLVATGIAVLLLGRATESRETDVAAPARAPLDDVAVAPRVAVPVPVAPAPGARPRRRAERKAAAAAAAAASADAQGELDARDVIPMLQAAGEREGIAAFPVPGTDPPKAGLVVPEDFVLPEGYVRHYQATDDGERLPAILMFHPDYEFVDAAGAPITLPEDGVVPPELAPSGLPLETLDVPATGRRP